MKTYKQILEAINRGIQLALDDIEDQQDIQQQSYGKIKNNYNAKEYLDLMNIVVDLGLPSGTLWCKFNLGCDKRFDFNRYKHEYCDSKADWYGNYYAWGELNGIKDEYTNDSYKFKLSSPFKSDFELALKYSNIHGLTQLLPEDDAAYQKLYIGNFKFHIPTKEQVEELIDNTYQKWKTNYLGYEGLSGRLFESKINGNYIFLPAAGWYTTELKKSKQLGNYWTSTLSKESNSEAYNFWFSEYNVNKPHIANHQYRFQGLSIRPVINL